MSDNDSGGILWFIAGLGVGAAVALLYAPQSGSETREAIRIKAEEGREMMRERTRKAREGASDWVDKGKDVINQQKEQIRSAYGAGKQAYKEATSGDSGA